MKISIKFWIVLFAIIVAAWYLMSPLFFSRAGLKVVSISSGASCGSLRIGDVITGIGGSRMPSTKDFYDASRIAKKGDRVAMVVNGGPGGCTAVADGDLGVSVEDVSRGWMKLGTDVAGGEKFTVRITSLAADETPTKIAEIIKRRFDAIGVKDAYTVVEDGAVGVYLPKGESINSVMFPGAIECAAGQEVKLMDGVAKIKIGGSTQSLSWDGKTVTTVNGTYKIGDAFELDGVKIRVANFTNSSLTVRETIFDNGGAKKLEGGQGSVAYDATSMSYVFSVPVELDDESSKRFSDVIGGLEPLYGSTSGVLNGLLLYYVDDVELSKLSIPSSILSSPVKAMSMTGGERTMDNAVYKKKLLDVALEGKIASALDAKDAAAFEGKMSWMLSFAELFLAGCASALFIAVAALYRNVRLALFAAVVPILEIIFILAVAEMSQSLSARGWVVDSATIAGICAFAAFSVLQTVMLTEKAARSRFSKLYTRLALAFIAAGVAVSFTPLNRFGLALAFGGILGYAIVKPFYEELASQFRR